MAGRIDVVGLGPGDENGIPLGTLRLLRGADRLWLRTEKHPVVRWLREEGISFQTFDHLYEKHADFESVYEAIAESLLEEAASGASPVYAVPGHPMVAERSVQLLLARGADRGVKVDVRGGGSFLDAAFARLGIDPVEGFALLDGTDLDASRIDPRLHLIIGQVYDRMVASDVKLALMEVFPDEYPITVASSLGVEGRERMSRMPLFSLDQDGEFDDWTLVYVSPAEDSGILRRRFDTLTEVIAHLRGPEGCPWDRKQTHQSLRKYLLEEAYEFLEAVGEEDVEAMAEELGDILLQVVLHAQIAREEGYFDIRDVVGLLTEKLIRRHPHVFGEDRASDAEDVREKWEAIKERERAEKGRPQAESLLDGVPRFPALLQATELQKRAAQVGFDWSRREDVRDKLLEELEELFRADAFEKREEELGDLLFSAVALARFFEVDAEQALLTACRKFIRRFRFVEQRAAEAGEPVESFSLERLDAWWDEAKRRGV